MSYVQSKPQNRIKIFVFSGIASVVAVMGLFLIQSSIGLNLSDPGFLWYGAQRVLAGEIPIRDFMSYDPGRYYWCAAFMGLFRNDGIITLRFAVAVVQVIGLIVGVYLVSSSQKKMNKTYTIFALLILLLWMFTRHKFFDISLSIMLVGVITHLVRSPNFWRYGLVGLFVGITAFFGRNHGVYGVIGSVGAIAWLNLFPFTKIALIKNFACWVVGVLVGFLPILIMMLFISGFRTAFIDSVLELFTQGTTNTSLPIPWPWNVEFSDIGAWKLTQQVLIGLFFVALPVFSVVSVLWIFFGKAKKKLIPPVIVAVSCLSFPYAHYAFSRADLGHLSLGIFPLLIGCIVLIGSLKPRAKWPLITLLLASSFLVVHTRHPVWEKITSDGLVSVTVYGSNLKVDPRTAHEINWLTRLIKKNVPTNRSIFITPYWPGAYAMFGQKSPVWEIYALRPRSPSFENKEIERIKKSNPALLFVTSWGLDGRDDLRFSSTHPLTYKFITDNYELSESTGSHHMYLPRDTNKQNAN